MSDIFEEVDDDLRRDRMNVLARRFGPYVIAAMILIVAAVAGFQAWQTWRFQQRQAATGELVAAVQAAVNNPNAVDGLTAFAAHNPPGDLSVLAKLSAAAALSRSGKIDDALAVYNGITSSGAPLIYREAANLLVVMVQIDKGDIADLLHRLEPLAAETSPWRYTARELQGLLAIRGGDTAHAAEIFKKLAADVGAPASIRSRATDLSALYGQS